MGYGFNPQILPYAPDQYDPGGGAGKGFSSPLPAPLPTAPAPRPMGLLGRIGQAGGAVNRFFTPNRLRAIGAGLHDLSTGDNSLPELLQALDAQRAQAAQRQWQLETMDRQRAEWKTQDYQREAASQ